MLSSCLLSDWMSSRSFGKWLIWVWPWYRQYSSREAFLMHSDDGNHGWQRTTWFQAPHLLEQPFCPSKNQIDNDVSCPSPGASIKSFNYEACHFVHYLFNNCSKPSRLSVLIIIRNNISWCQIKFNYRRANENSRELTLQLAQEQRRRRLRPQEAAAAWELHLKIWLESMLETRCLLETPE